MAHLNETGNFFEDTVLPNINFDSIFHLKSGSSLSQPPLIDQEMKSNHLLLSGE